MHPVAIEYRQTQIRELYGPLECLLERSRRLHRVLTTIIRTDQDDWARAKGDDGIFRPHRLKNQRNIDLWFFFTDRYFIPSNSRIRFIIESRYDLLDAYEFPQSFKNFFSHEAQYQAMRKLEKRGKIDVPTEQLEDNPWPKTFDEDVKAILSKLVEEVRKTIDQLS